ncbi:LAMI_0D07008g1_1 [Lachancea mirantina]|uniref:LAMI_0D07008g1_1 n=1 Tax=Lachancea mirantina TaxID=1230905 RepID=A0A1G4JCP3_9SACH|nr:LAMI_0D07008g1_1 [Lachancea mirantina]
MKDTDTLSNPSKPVGNELKSGLRILRDLNLNQLLAVQYDLTREIERRVAKIQNQPCEHEPVRYKRQRTGPRRNSAVEEIRRELPDFKPDLKSNGKCQPTQEESASDSYLPGTLDMQSKEIDFSSPLKGPVVSKPESTEMSKKSMAVISDSEGDLDWSESESPQQIKQQQTELIEFNENPLTGKPWIFEDFKINDFCNAQEARGRVNADVQKFHKMTGLPTTAKKLVLDPNVGFQIVSQSIKKEEESLESSQENFENLKVRSKSPPGYGRLDFPNTQENLADKRQAREILVKKTKKRFLEATRSDKTYRLRSVVFRDQKLNEIVDLQKFTWSEKSLRIFSRD